jgi:hypothetical protein
LRLASILPPRDRGIRGGPSTDPGVRNNKPDIPKVVDPLAAASCRRCVVQSQECPAAIYASAPDTFAKVLWRPRYSRTVPLNFSVRPVSFAGRRAPSPHTPLPHPSPVQIAPRHAELFVRRASVVSPQESSKKHENAPI